MFVCVRAYVPVCVRVHARLRCGLSRCVSAWLRAPIYVINHPVIHIGQRSLPVLSSLGGISFSENYLKRNIYSLGIIPPAPRQWGVFIPSLTNIFHKLLNSYVRVCDLFTHLFGEKLKKALTNKQTHTHTRTYIHRLT